MAQRPIKPQHRHLVEKVQNAHEEEKRARDRAQAVVKKAVDDARAETNRLIFEAVDAGVTKRNLEDALNLSYATIYNREYEHKVKVGYTAPTEGELASVVDRSVTVTRDDELGTYTVDLERFSHPDVGSEVTGRVVYDEDGDVKIGDESVIQGDPFLADRLWATQEVQSRVQR